MPENGLRPAVEFELEAICNDQQFRSSHRNCAFLRYVVTETLEGHATDLRERTLGAVLFGRPISYDTGSDSVVRVRANDVRKRLASYYETHKSKLGWRIQMPLRGYAPHFLPEPPEVVAEADPEVIEAAESPNASEPELTLAQMMMPTLVAIFLCVATFRWQVFSGTPYLDFWDSLLAGRSAIALVLDADSNNPRAVSTDDLKVVSPLLEAAATMHIPTLVRSSADPAQDRGTVVPIHITHLSPSDRTIPPDAQQRAYLTIVPGKQPEMWIAGTNTTAIELAIHSMSNEDAFPQALVMALRRNTPTHIRIVEGQQVTVQKAAAGGEPWPR